VSVATLWTAPGLARPVDAPSLTNPADPRLWVASMTDAQKRWLSVGRTQTQALYGTRVRLLATQGSWSKVAIPSQPSPKSSWGYPGWLPTRQLTTSAPVGAVTTAIVTARTAWLWRSPATVGTTSARVMEVSYGTQLPVVSVTPTTVEVATLGGTSTLALRRGVVALRASGVTPPAPTGAAVVAEALRFLGKPYLWAGTSGFGLDCSGLTYLTYRRLGVTIPRDAAVQAVHGTAVAKRNLRPGDLVFVKNASGVVHHVAMYVGVRNGVRTVVESPRTGAVVRLRPLSQWTWQYAGARRYL
jgi:cell wall-associated NlpC family hydrolase